MKFFKPSAKHLLYVLIFFSGVGISNWAVSQGKGPTLKLGDPLPENLFVELAKAVNPAVVNISTTTVPKGRNLMNDPMLELLQRFYGGQGFQMPQAQPQTALGTGFIIREDGLIITNNHVIEGADVINVQLSEGAEKTYKAELIGRDARTDLALIKIKSEQKLMAVPLGSSKDVQVGEWVAAFGNPYGHGHTMTKGIISAKGREIEELNRFPFLQTDASINPGNSGGPLVNAKGFVIGVNSAIDARAQGIGFAIPIDEAKSVIAELEKTGHVRQGYLGVYMDMLNPKAAAHLGITQTEGVIITQVIPSSPAEKAGLETYDVILELSGKKIKTPPDLSNTVASLPIGQATKIKILRNNKEKELSLTIAERSEDKKVVKQNKKSKGFGTQAPFEIGLTLANIDSSIVKEWSIDEDLTGLPVITEILAGSPAASSGLRPGDVIFDVNRKRVRSANDAIKAFTKGSNSLRIMRDGNMGFAIIDAN
jgi:serine protease Do